MSVLSVNELAGDGVLSGATNGLAAMLKAARAIPPGEELVILDFCRVDVATGSFLRSFVLGLRDYCRSNRPGANIIVANLSEAVLEELADLLTGMRDALVTCALSARGATAQPRVLGLLEDKQKETLDAVLQEGEADAPSLAAKYDDSTEGAANKWNNRLASLAAKCILKERRLGRIKRYSPILEGLTYGN